LLRALKETATGDFDRSKAAQLARLAGNKSSTLQRAKRRVRELHDGEKSLEAAIDLLTQARVLTGDSTSRPQDRRCLD
jgi:DNA mismatch repair ATPase MutS